MKYVEFQQVRGMNLYLTDPLLRGLTAKAWDASVRERAEPLLRELGRLAGTLIDEQAEYTDRHAPPRLVPVDREGNRLNKVAYNPLHAEARRQVYGLGVVGRCHGPDPLPPTFHFVSVYLISQSDTGLACPVTLTGATAHVIARYGTGEQKERYLPRLAVREPGPFFDGATWVTEKQGGSDVGANAVAAAPAEDGYWRLSGEKWFCSNADADVALVTARPQGAPAGARGLALFIVSRELPGGGLNSYRIRRLKDKLGTTSVATGEVELDEAVAELLAPPPEGFRLMMEALQFSRIDNAFGSAGLMRRAFLEAVIYAARRPAFGNTLVRYPMVQETLMDMLADWEAGLLLACEAGAAWERWLTAGTPETAAWQRLVTALAKYRTAEDAVRNASRAIEILGGNGYVEEYATARLLRDAQVVPVWEGPANIQALEVLRALSKLDAGRLYLARIDAVLEQAAGHPPAAALASVLREETRELSEAMRWLAANPGYAPHHARRLSDWLAELLQTALLLEQSVPELAAGNGRTLLVAQWFARARLARPARRGLEPSSTALLDHLGGLMEPVLGHEPVPADPLPGILSAIA